MEEFRLGDQLVRYDREATVTAYNVLPSGDAERCNCVYCRNFAAQREDIYPSDFRALLDQLGIDPNKEGEVFDMAGPDERRIRPTGGWFYFVGELVEKGERLIRAGDFQYWFQPSFPRPPARFGERVSSRILRSASLGVGRESAKLISVAPFISHAAAANKRIAPSRLSEIRDRP